MVYSSDLRWLVVFKRLVLGDDHHAVTGALEGICRHTQDGILWRFFKTGTVDTWQGQRTSQAHNLVIGAEEDMWLFGNVIDDPTATFNQRATAFLL